MIQTQMRRAPRSTPALVPVLALIAALGWGALGYSLLKSGESERDLRDRVTSLEIERSQLRSEKDKIETSLGSELKQAREQLSSARDEVKRLSEQHEKVQAELAEAQAHLKAIRPGKSPVAFIDVTPLPAKQDVVAAQKALTELGYGKLEADGVVGPSTKKAVEEYQKAMGLTVTGELHAETLQALLGGSSQMASQ